MMEKGEVDGNHWEEVCKHLSGNLKTEALQSCLGQLASSSRNLSTLTDCADALNSKHSQAGGNQDDRVTFVQEVPTLGCTGVTKALHGNLLSFTWP